MYKFLLLACCFLPASVSAQTTLMLGVYSHDYTDKTNAPVFTVKTTGKNIEFLMHGDGTSMTAVLLTKQQRKGMWEYLSLDPVAESYAEAECIAAKSHYICHVPTKARRAITWIADHQSDYFYYDSFFGVMEIHKIAPGK